MTLATSAVNNLEASSGTLAAYLACTVGASGNAATIVARATVVSAIGQALAGVGQNSLAAASAVVLSYIQSSSNSLDPALALFLNNSLQIALAQFQLLQNVASVIPFLSSSVEGVIANFAAGLSAGAAAELAKYSPQTPAA